VICPIRRGLGLLWVLTALALPASAAAFTPQQITGFQQILQLDQQQAGYPGEILGVWQRGKGKFVGTAGVSSLATNSSVSIRDHFRIGSVTKTFTATVILQLTQRGELRLSDHIDHFLRGIPGGKRVTIKRLLNQTSGYPDISDTLSNEIEAHPQKQRNVRRLVLLQ
jgi:D-alanyl-D-alanine carboxypeptidase